MDICGLRGKERTVGGAGPPGGESNESWHYRVSMREDELTRQEEGVQTLVSGKGFQKSWGMDEVICGGGYLGYLMQAY